MTNCTYKKNWSQQITIVFDECDIKISAKHINLIALRSVLIEIDAEITKNSKQ